MKKNRCAWILMVLGMCMLVACGKNNDFSKGTDTEVEDKVEDVSTSIVQMPEIVFLNKITNMDDSCMVTFWDNKGNYYCCKDSSICGVSISELIENYKTQPDKFELLSQKLDAEELMSYYQEVCKIATNDGYGMVEPDELPTVEARNVHLYGVYYDEEGVLKEIVLHEERCSTDIYSKDENANKIYDWYRQSISVK